MSKPYVKRRPMSPPVINPQTTVFKSFTSDQFHNYGIVFTLLFTAMIAIVYSIFFGVYGYSLMTSPEPSDIGLIDSWMRKDTVKTTNIYLLYVFCLPSITYMVIQLFRWSIFFIQGATFAYDRDNLWSTQTYWKSVASISVTYALGILICSIVFTVAGMIIASSVSYLMVNIFVIWWVNAILILGILTFSVMCYVRYKKRQKLEVQLILENDSYVNQ